MFNDKNILITGGTGNSVEKLYKIMSLSDDLYLIIKFDNYFVNGTYN